MLTTKLCFQSWYTTSFSMSHTLFGVNVYRRGRSYARVYLGASSSTDNWQGSSGQSIWNDKTSAIHHSFVYGSRVGWGCNILGTDVLYGQDVAFVFKGWFICSVPWSPQIKALMYNPVWLSVSQLRAITSHHSFNTRGVINLCQPITFNSFYTRRCPVYTFLTAPSCLIWYSPGLW